MNDSNKVQPFGTHKHEYITDSIKTESKDSQSEAQQHSGGSADDDEE